VKEPPGAPSLILGSLNNGLSNKAEPFGGCSREDMSSEFGGADGRSGRIEGSDRDQLYFFFKKMQTQKCK